MSFFAIVLCLTVHHKRAKYRTLLFVDRTREFINMR